VNNDDFGVDSVQNQYLMPYKTIFIQRLIFDFVAFIFKKINVKYLINYNFG